VKNNHHSKLRLSVCISASFGLTLPHAVWANQGAGCPVDQQFVMSNSSIEGIDPDSVYVEADDALMRDKGTSEFKGNVYLQKGDQRLVSDLLLLERETEIATAKKNVVFNQGNMTMKMPKAIFDLKNKTSEVFDAKYQIKAEMGKGHDARGVASKAERNGKDNVTTLHQATYTTCNTDTPLWSLSSSKVNLDHDKEQGTARNVTFNVSKYDVPVFYLPYFSFPLSDKRKSGFLMPGYSSNERNGFGLSLPYYFNLAPNYDLTLTPNILTRRGVLLSSQFRYLLPEHKGQFTFDVLPDDSDYQNKTRYSYGIEHESKLPNDWSVEILAGGVSDNDYFSDFGGSLAASSITTLQRKITVDKEGDNWDFMGRLQSYQLLDGGTKPYERLPQLLFSYSPEMPYGLDFDLNTELVRYANKPGASDASRFDVKAKLSKSYEEMSHFIKPALTLRHTQYEIDDNPLGSNSITRTLPSFSVDAGVFFDRYFDDGKKVQTLEPRLYYVKTPYKDQSDIPNFDSSRYSFNYNRLFTDNAFSGRDRVEDADRLSLSLTSRIEDRSNGRELFEATIGQIFYFDDRNVTLPGGAVETSDQSELIIEASANINKNLKVGAEALWDSNEGSFNSGELDLHYKDDKKRVLNLAYRQLDDELEQSHVSFVYPAQNGWKAIGSWDYDIERERNLETMLGVEYDTCCMKTRFVGRNYLTSSAGGYDNAFFVEFAFKGLGSLATSSSFDPSSGIGMTNASDVVEGRIYGYE
jgi:LPS-assembly protein